MNMTFEFLKGEERKKDFIRKLEVKEFLNKLSITGSSYQVRELIGKFIKTRLNEEASK